ncbi:unnamed protein product [Somion occarium]
MPAAVWLTVLIIPTLYALYVWLNDAKLKRPPGNLGSEPWTQEFIQETFARVSEKPDLLEGQLPSKTGRRYIVIGGAGFLGGWIVLHLLQRGEDPRKIRILDIRPPSRKDLKEAARDVDFIQVDMTDADAVFKAFQKPWPATEERTPELTVFHTAAVIRFFERHPDLLYLSDNINLEGTKNIVNAARAVGASALIYTSSGSVAVRRSRFWLWPWQSEAKHFVQVITDDDNQLPKRHEEFFSNYAVSKLHAERFVRDSDGSKSGDGILRTGCLRPGNGIFGPGGDILVDRLIRDKVNPSWIPSIMQSFIYVENCSLAHLCYEARLIELQSGNSNPDIGGQAFCITDAGPTPTYLDVYNAVGTLCKGAVSFIYLSPTFMLSIAHLVEWYYLARHFLVNSSFAFLGRLFPAIRGDIIFLQPSMFALTNVHLLFDDSRARTSSEKGGLGYTGPCTTLEGVCKVVLEYEKNGGEGTERAVAGHPEPTKLKFDPTLPERGVVEIVGKISSGLGVDPTKTWN